MTSFKNYLKKLADHEDKKTLSLKPSPRDRILINAGVRLNWLGDFVSNPKIKFKRLTIPVEKIYFTGTNPGWNNLLLKKCKGLVSEFSKQLEQNQNLRHKFIREASFGRQPILVRRADKAGYYKVLDGMHRLVGAVIKDKKKIEAFLPADEKRHLPICEPHLIYDLIRGYQRNANDASGAVALCQSLKLLIRCYSNVPDLLKKRFNLKYIPDKKVQKIIQRALHSKRG